MKNKRITAPSMKHLSLGVSIAVFGILTAAIIIIINFSRVETAGDPLKDTTNVGLILVGPKDDRGWSSSHYEALERISDELHLNIVVKENIPTDNRCYNTIKDLVEDDNCRIVICASDQYGKYCEEAAKKYSDRVFLHCAGREEGPNIGSYFGRMYEIRYLSGIIAGNQTKTGHIGYVAAFPSSTVDRGINAFTLGVRSVNPDATVHVSFCNSWTEDSLAMASVNMLIDKCDSDVIATHTDSLSALRKADERGAWIIDCDYDNSELFPNTYLTGCVWKWDSYYREQILSVLQGKFRGEWQWLGIESGIMELVDPAKTGNAYPGYETALENAREQLTKHTTDVFFGPINDIDGRLRIPEGESMSDDRMYDNFDWYVEGVKIEARVK